MADGEFPKNENTRAAIQRGVDHDDLSREMKGDNASRISRFGLADNHARVKRQKKRDKEQLDHALKMSALYAALYQDAEGHLHKAEVAVHDAITIIDKHIEKAEDRVAKDLETASVLPGEERVFRAADGSVRTADNRILEVAEIALITWREDAVSWEQFQGHRVALDDLRQRRETLSGYDAELFDIRNRMQDNENKPSEEELEAFIEREREIEREATNLANLAPTAEISEPESKQQTALNLDAFGPK